jgi:hypothetical protein
MIDHTRIDGAQFLHCGLKAIHYSFHYHKLPPTPPHNPHALKKEECVILERVEIIFDAFLKEEGCCHMAV